jgi:glycosyltransferase involved in cell wall biosynthesis
VLGSLAPHKNIGMLLALTPQLQAHGFRLAIAGLTDGAVFAGAGGDGPTQHGTVHWLGRIDDGALAALLADSLCLAFPSLTEGFGLPPLEAMARGCPVVVTNRASLPEICGRGALCAPPDAPDAWLGHFLRLRDDTALRTAQISRGLAQAKTFSWDASAATYLAAMQAMAR